jgi:hypothetical protein
MKARILVAALTLLAIVSVPAGAQNESTVIDYVRPALEYAGGAARVYYAAKCPAQDYGVFNNGGLLFPGVDVQPPPPGSTGATALRQIFRDAPDAVVAQDSSGMLRITIGSISTTILQTRISILSLDSFQQYSPKSAVLAILNAPEVYAVERSRNLSQPLRAVSIIGGGPTEGEPHLPKLVENVTVDEALDAVARTFKGIVLYGTCELPDGKGLFQVDFR